ncbi:MAG TPA: hypothetical protein PKO06_01495 [Candidatus Ozemobacteraceae bacterium]|nr:hypothetical protein [Candidatus Ozemobacteraceae bacterium]
MADKLRFEVFARFLVERFGACRIYDVAGGMGRLNQELTHLGCRVTTFDSRHKHLEVTYDQREFALDVPCDCDLVVGLHPDAATRVIIEYAGQHRVPCAVVPCCSDNSMSYKPWMRYLATLAEGVGLQVTEATLPLTGRNRVLLGYPIDKTQTSSSPS